VDREHGNAYQAWKAMGSPQPPDPAQYAELEAASRLEPLTAPAPVAARGGRVVVRFSLPRQGVSLIRLISR
jgi:xylan 1,4-beta-xylosidase